MKYTTALLLIITTILVVLNVSKISQTNIPSGAPPYDEAFDNPPQEDQYAWIRNWTRPEVAPTVVLQVGHWKNNELPDELERLKGNTGASGGGKSEWEVNLKIAQLTAELLKAEGINVSIVPSTVPPKTWGDAFIAIHADGSLDTEASGFKVAPPRRDFSNSAQLLSDAIERSYAQKTSLSQDPNITRNMRGYYAFAWWRHEHAIHPMTPGVILETGFLTNHNDRKIIVNNPQLSAQGLADGIINFLQAKGIIVSVNKN